MRRGHGAYLFKDFAPLLVKIVVLAVRVVIVRIHHITDVGANIVGEDCFRSSRENVIAVFTRTGFSSFNDRRCGDIPKNEMAVSVAEIILGRGEFWVDGQHRAGCSRSDHLIGSLECEGCSRTGNQHVKAKPLNPECLLNLNGYGWVVALGIGARNDHCVDVTCRFIGGYKCFLRGFNRNFGLIGKVSFSP